ncbi:MAG: NAD(P)H-dependent oxidoreductase subunit E, partial [Leptospira sp.]|nr:NAD(P)H-dependent oxidoreductase subunit E [Leptospira sp.]
EKGQTTKDKKFTVDEVQCLGACGYGPMMQINENYHEHLTAEKIDKILESLE